LATIYDVAKRASVSVATVSSVVNSSSYVSPELRRRVDAAIAELSYSPNLLARGLAKQTTFTIGVLIPDIANFFYPELVRGIEDKAKELGYTILLGSSDNQIVKEEVYLNLFLSKRVDGIVWIKAPGETTPTLLQMLKTQAAPIVLLDREYPSLPADTVLADDFGGGYMGTKHLLDLGHRRIGYIRGLPGASTTDGRLKGYKAALKERKIPFDPALIATGDYGIESGYIAGRELLEASPTAVFVTNYMMSIGFLRVAKEKKIVVPRDLSVVSYDDFLWNDVFEPQLTCIAQPKYKLGLRAAEILFSRIQKKHKRFRTEVLENTLQVRSSAKRRGEKSRTV